MLSELLDSLRMSHRELTLRSPLAGDIVPLTEVRDATFSKGLLGRGVAIKPRAGRVVAPSDARVDAVFPTGHAIALHTVEGLDVLIHVGIDTVSLGGRYFQVKTSLGDEVRAGEVLITFDRQAIAAEGLDLTVPVLIRNAAEYRRIKVRSGEVDELDRLMVATER